MPHSSAVYSRSPVPCSRSLAAAQAASSSNLQRGLQDAGHNLDGFLPARQNSPCVALTVCQSTSIGAQKCNTSASPLLYITPCLRCAPCSRNPSANEVPCKGQALVKGKPRVPCPRFSPEQLKEIKSFLRHKGSAQRSVVLVLMGKERLAGCVAPPASLGSFYGCNLQRQEDRRRGKSRALEPSRRAFGMRGCIYVSLDRAPCGLLRVDSGRPPVSQYRAP